MQRKLACSIVIVFVLSASCVVFEAKTNFKPSPVEITINSPTQNGPISSTVTLEVTITVFLDYLNTSEHRWIAYSLDGQNNVTMSPNYQGVSGSGEFQYSTVTAEGTLSGLSQGYHSLAVYAKYDYGRWVNEGATTAKFSVGSPAGLPPPDEHTPITVINCPLSNQKVDQAASIPYSITIAKPTGGLGSILTIGYTLDKSLTIIAGENIKYANSPPTGFVFNGSVPAFVPQFMGNSKNVTLKRYLPSLTEGSHNMQVFIFYYEPTNSYCQTTVSSISHFSVGNQIIQPNASASESNLTGQLSDQMTFPMILVLGGASLAAVIVIGLLVLYKKYKK